MKVETSARVVFVLGRKTELDVGELAEAAVASEVVILSLGFPVSAEQRRVIDAALALAAGSRVALDLVLVTAVSELRELASDAHVVVTGSRRERRRLYRSLLPA